MFQAKYKNDDGQTEILSNVVTNEAFSFEDEDSVWDLITQIMSSDKHPRFMWATEVKDGNA